MAGGGQYYRYTDACKNKRVPAQQNEVAGGQYKLIQYDWTQCVREGIGRKTFWFIIPTP